MNPHAGIDPLTGMPEAPVVFPPAQEKRSGAPGRRAGDLFPHAFGGRIGDQQFFKRTMLVVGMTIATVLVASLIWFANEVFLVLFAAILLAVLLRAPTNWLLRHTPLSENIALLLSMAAAGAVLALLVYVFAVPMADQVGQLVETLPKAMVGLRRWVYHYSWAHPLRSVVAELGRFHLDVQTLGKASGLLTGALDGLVGIVVILFIGCYLAAQPRLYQRGFMRLLPPKAKERADDVLDEVGRVLRRWLIGRLITMAVVGVAAGIGLWWLEIPQAFTLGLLSGFLEFVPYFGPILSALPALLVAFNVDPTHAIYVLVLYVIIQSAEGYLLSPLIEQRTVALPPALVIFATLLMGALAGPLGIILASPLTATGLVAVRLLYVEDVVDHAHKVVQVKR